MQSILRKLGPALLLSVAFSLAGTAQTQPPSEDKTLAPYFFVQGDPAVDHLPLKNTRVQIDVSGVIADVKVLQTYRNEGSRPINARYVFPASTRAAVYAMQMRIGEQVIVAKIKEREQAKQEFEQAKRDGKSASLLEQQRPNVFSMNLANAMPGEQIEIELHYTELLVPTDGVYEVVFPTVVGPRYSSQPEAAAPSSDQWIKSPYLREGRPSSSAFHLSARLSTGVPLRDLSCPSHNIAPQWLGPASAQFSLEQTGQSQANKDFILRYRLTGEQLAAGLLLYQGADENFFLYMAQPPERVATAAIPAREYIFVVDVSGSMNGFPLDTAKALLKDLIGQLRPTDLFNVVLFAGDAAALAPHSLRAEPENLAKAIRLIEQQRGNGGTELLAAIQQAMALPRQSGISRSVVLVTDGFVSGEQGAFDYIRDHLNQCNVFSFGIGSSVNRYLIEGVAKAGMGEPFIVTKAEEAPAVAAKFREYIQTPLLTDLRVTATGFDIYDVAPTHLPDLFARRPIVLFGKWRGPLTGAFELRGKTGDGDYLARMDVAGVKPEESNRALRYLWARSRIAELSDYGASDLPKEQINEITALGLKYNLLTRYTSFIAVREVVTNKQGAADDVEQPLPLPEGVSEMAVGSEPELVWLLVVMAAFAMLMVFRGRRTLA
ncbi:MAG TPA: VIT domain-containing protein [Blastocatellia bacterium]|nr:VIT domain-containing protein [Blastocatellia bacterium]HMX29695.1 VIT domain-containing protein [Blastocatellia bacterium]HMY73559.1 VIT domain-containing protein [Blastocatellia bacterium]HMZ18050.1 VIT domain-containing protein [Blastocatellia bacterium]HNG34431.1 VIT domain-containing protein [Blastocatellia bacterium]